MGVDEVPVVSNTTFVPLNAWLSDLALMLSVPLPMVMGVAVAAVFTVVAWELGFVVPWM